MKIIDQQKVLLGPPGCGKTTSIMTQVEQDLRHYKPEEIAFVSFTKKAVREGVDRVCRKFNLPPSRFPYFQTIHSMCYRQLGCQRNDLMGRREYEELGTILGYELSASNDIEDGMLVIPDKDKGSKLLFFDNMARIMRRDLRDVWKNADSGIMWAEVERFSSVYQKYKDNSGKMDFTDLLSRYIEDGIPTGVKVAYIDEAQDLSRIQWEALSKCFAGVDKLVIAGDDDQSIFKWSGADLHTFLSLKGDVEVLAHSYRLPLAVFNKAASIVGRVKQRFAKPFTPAGHVGAVNYVSSFDHVRINPEESTLILVRNVYLLGRIYADLMIRGISFTGRNGYESVNDEHVKAIIAWERIRKGDAVPLDMVKAMYEQLRVGEYLARGGKVELLNTERSDETFTWETLRDHYGLLSMPVWHQALIGIPLEKREYYIGLLRRKIKLSSAVNVHVNTIHGVKGGEADHVIIISDMSKRTYEEMQKDPCSEHRVAYVAVTRAKEKLTIVMPEGKYSYPY